MAFSAFNLASKLREGTLSVPKRIGFTAVATCWATILNAQNIWQHSPKTTDQNGKAYCQTMSPQGLGFRFYEDDYYVIGFLDVDASSNVALKKIMDAGEASVILQPDTAYAYFTTMAHEITERKAIGDQNELKLIASLVSFMAEDVASRNRQMFFLIEDAIFQSGGVPQFGMPD